MAVHTSPALLKQRVGTARTYIRPVQRDLDVTPLEDHTIDVVSIIIIIFIYSCHCLTVIVHVQLEEKCLTCGSMYPLDQLSAHATECEKVLREIEDQETKEAR